MHGYGMFHSIDNWNTPVHVLTSVNQVRENSGPECPCRQNCAGKQKTSQCILPNFAEVVNMYCGQC